MTDYTPTADWRQIDTSTIEGLQALKRAIGLRLGFDADDPNTDDEWRDWPNDLNAAFNLPIATACDMSATHHPQAFDENARYSASISWYTPNDDGTHTLNTYSEWDVSPALVLCKAWLAWHDASTLGA